MTGKKKMLLFIWAKFCPDHSDGLAFAVAETEEEARQMVTQKMVSLPREWGKLRVYKLGTKVAFCVTGGG